MTGLSPQQWDTFWSRTKHGLNGCVLWTAGTNGSGYGVIRINRAKHYAHRLAYARVHGTIPDGLVIDHLCRTRNCVNTEHLEAITPTENARRVQARLACPAGHPYTPVNTYRAPGSTTPICRACHRLREQRRKTQRRAERAALVANPTEARERGFTRHAGDPEPTR